jgi:hypothetical protein
MKVELVNTLAESRTVRMKRPANFISADEHWFIPWVNYHTNDQEIFLLRRLAKIT